MGGEVTEVIGLYTLQIHGRHIATNRLVTGAYASEYGNSDVIEKAMKKVQVWFRYLTEAHRRKYPA